jgi:cadmium resistance protein CadD (predicted permease)
MNELASHLGLAVVVFVSTNVDDILLLALLFADARLQPRSVILGQVLGIAALVAISAVAAVAALAVPGELIALLGAVPLFLGLKRLRQLRRAAASPDSDEPHRSAHAGSAGSEIASVALLMIANGGDNLGVYVPLFAREPAVIGLYSLVFAALTVVWCVAGYAVAHQRAVAERLARYGHIALPLVLIGLGIWILTGALPLLQ